MNENILKKFSKDLGILLLGNLSIILIFYLIAAYTIKANSLMLVNIFGIILIIFILRFGILLLKGTAGEKLHRITKIIIIYELYFTKKGKWKRPWEILMGSLSLLITIVFAISLFMLNYYKIIS